MENGSAFERMMKTAREWLAGKAPEDIARLGGIRFDAERSVFELTSFGRDMEISYPDYVFSEGVDEWHQMSILHYLNLADGTPPSGEWISLSQMNSGMIRGGGFDLRFEQEIAALMQEIHEEVFIYRCQRMGGKLIEGNADIEILFSFFPSYPVYIKIWLADEEFPASGRMLLDASADHYLSIEDAVTVGEVLLEKIKNYGSV